MTHSVGLGIDTENYSRPVTKMDDNTILIPVAVQIALTLWLYIVLAMAKSKASKRGEVNQSRRALHSDAWPPYVLQINNNIRNQFELPVLFYVLIGALWGVGAVNDFVHVAAWVFVASRLLHSKIHLGSNHVPTRLKAFAAGSLALIALLAVLVYHVVWLG